MKKITCLILLFSKCAFSQIYDRCEDGVNGDKLATVFINDGYSGEESALKGKDAIKDTIEF